MVEGLPQTFADYEARPVTLGNSGAQVFRLVAAGKPTLFFKKSEAAYGSQRRAEAARLEWLQNKLPVPKTVYFYEDEFQTALVTTAVPGSDLTHFNGESPALKRRMTVALALSLKQFHAAEAHGCPFDHSAARELERLETHLLEREALTGDSPDLQTARLSLEKLHQTQPREDLVLTHGDACLPNILVLNSELSGFIDLGAVGLGDRCRDLERACWSLGYNYGEGFDEVFLGAYGATELDRTKLDFYRELEGFSVSK